MAALEEDGSARWPRLKSVLAHVGLMLALTLYTVAGGLIFRELESPAEEARLAELTAEVRAERALLLRRLVNLTDDDVEAAVARYEAALEAAVRGGVAPGAGDDLEPPPQSRWNVLQAVFFASTVLTTIGYGNIAPVTWWGRVFCVLFALIGIPLTLSVIADLGRLLATGVQLLMGGQRLQWASRPSLAALGAVLFLLLYLAAGAAVFMLWEDEWGFHEGFYFCFITMTTIGFGDLVPKKPKYMLVCTLYILTGLALTSTIIELVRRQYAQSWRRLQELSGPLAETLRRLGERGGGIDVAALHKMLAVVSVPRRLHGGEKGAKEWEEAMAAVLRDLAAPKEKKQPVLQIVIYESTV